MIDGNKNLRRRSWSISYSAEDKVIQLLISTHFF